LEIPKRLGDDAALIETDGRISVSPAESQERASRRRLGLIRMRVDTMLSELIRRRCRPRLRNRWCLGGMVVRIAGQRGICGVLSITRASPSAAPYAFVAAVAPSSGGGRRASPKITGQHSDVGDA